MRILLVDDDHELGTMLKEFFTAEGIEAVIAGNGDIALKTLESSKFNAIVLDIMLPDISGIDLLRTIRKHSNIPIIMLTAKGDDIDRVIGLELGADDYMPKPCYPRELLARLRAIFRRFEEKKVVVSPTEELSLHGLRISPKRRSVFYNDNIIELTASEFNLLEVLFQHLGQVVTKDTLSEKAIGRKRQVYDRSVDVHISNLRQKLLIATHENVTIETQRAIGYSLKFNNV